MPKDKHPCSCKLPENSLLIAAFSEAERITFQENQQMMEGRKMKLTGMLKKQVEKAETREAAKETIAKAGMLLTDDKLDQVSGG